MASAVGNDNYTYGIWGEATHSNLNNAAERATSLQHVKYIDEVDYRQCSISSGAIQNGTSDIDYIKFQFSSGNIASGTIIQYGRKYI
jgi:hypothetical protein